MEHLRKHLKPHRSSSTQQQNHSQEEKEALLTHPNDPHMAQQSFRSQDLKEDIAVRIDNDTNPSGSKENGLDSKSSSQSSGNKSASSSKKFRVSFEQVLNQAVQRRNKEFSDEEHSQSSFSNSFRQNSWRQLVKKTKSRLIDPPEEQYQRTTERTANSSSGDFRDGSDHSETDVEDIPEEYKKMKFSTLTMLQWVSLVLILAALVCSFSIPVIKRQRMWDLPLWKWEVMILALICGRLVSGWGIKLVVHFIERNFLLRKRVLYFVYGLRKAVQNCLWVGLVLLVWHCIFSDKVEEETNSKILPYATKVLVCLLVGALVWLLKTLVVKVLASSFHVNTFFERIQEAIFNQYVVETLSGPPKFEWRSTAEEQVAADHDHELRNSKSMPNLVDLKTTLLASRSEKGTENLQKGNTVGKRLRISRAMSFKKKDEEISINKLHKLNQKNISAWNMRRMINIVRHSTLSTLEENILDSDMEDESSLHIRSECQAKEAAKKIFHNVAKNGSQHILFDDVMCFMDKHEALKAMRHFGASCESEGITKSALNNWLVNVFRERRALALSLNDTKTAVDELHNMLNFTMAVIIIIIWLMILGLPVTHFLVFISSQLLLVVFIFGNTCKTTFEAIIFLFIMHPFDVGDRCEVDGVQMIVEEMNILTTVFLRYDNQKIIYPNSVLATKPIGNFYRSPDMAETVDFCIHISTPMEKIALMKERIKEYVEGKNDHWHPSPMVIVKDLEDMNRINMSVAVMHRMNHQEMGERFARRTILVEEMIKLFRQLEIEYRMLPLDVNLRSMPPLVSNRLPSNWTTIAT